MIGYSSQCVLWQNCTITRKHKWKTDYIDENFTANSKTLTGHMRYKTSINLLLIYVKILSVPQAV